MVLFIQPYARGFAIAFHIDCFHPSSIFLLLFFFLFFIAHFNLKLSFSFFGSNICESNAKTQLKPPIRFLSKSLTCLEFVGRAINYLLLSRWTQTLKELAELHFLG